MVNFIKLFLSPEECAQRLPKIYVDEGTKDYLRHGSPVFASGVLAFTSDLEKGSTTAIFDLENNLLGFGIAELNAEELGKEKKGLAIKTDVVFI